MARKNNHIDNRERYSVSKKLRSQNKSNDLFEIMLNKLTLEEMLSLKLELVNKSVGSNMYGIPFWKHLDDIVKDAMLRYALAVCPSKRGAAVFLGLQNKIFFRLLIRYGLRNYHEEVWGKDPNSNRKMETNE